MLVLIASVHFLHSSHLVVSVASILCASSWVSYGLESNQFILAVSASFASTVIAIIFREYVPQIPLIASTVVVFIHLQRAVLGFETIVFLFVEGAHWDIVYGLAMALRCLCGLSRIGNSSSHFF